MLITDHFSSPDRALDQVHVCACLNNNWRYVATRTSGCTVASGVVGVGIVVVGIYNHSQLRTSKCTCLIFGVSIGLDHG